jgi:hypothetical protein
MPFTVIQCRIFGAKIIGYGIARREPPAHLLDAGATLLCSAVCCVTRFGGILLVDGGIGDILPRFRDILIVFFVN